MEKQQIEPNAIIENLPGLQIIYLGKNNYYYNIDKDIINQGIFIVLDFMLKDDNLEEIMYDGPEKPIVVFHHKYGMCETSVLIDENIASSLIKWIVQYNQKTISQYNPIFDGSLYDGSRVNITIPPASPKYSTITIRKFKARIITFLDIIKSGMLSEDITAFIWTAVDGLGYKPANMLVVGGTGSGKTTFLNSIMMFIPVKSRIVTIEDTAELKIKQTNLLTMIADKEKGITMDMLLKNALRQRPDRIIVGEVRSQEATTMFGAMNTGHDGCMGTLHANNARESVDRVTNPPMNVPPMMLNELDLIIVLKKITTPKEEKRVIEEITEVSAFGGQVRFNQLYAFNAKKNKLIATGIPSRLREKISKEAGIDIKQYDFMLKDRTRILKRLIEIDKKTSISEDDLFSLIENNRYHWQDELAKTKYQKFNSAIKRFFKKEDVLYLLQT